MKVFKSKWKNIQFSRVQGHSNKEAVHFVNWEIQFQRTFQRTFLLWGALHCYTGPEKSLV